MLIKDSWRYNEIKNYCTFCFLLLFAVVVGMVGTVVIGGFVDMATGVNLWWLHRSPWQHPPVIEISIGSARRPKTWPTWVEILSQILSKKC